MTDVRVVYDPNRIRPQPGNGAPKPVGKAATDERYRLGEYLDAVLATPLGMNDEQRQARVEKSLDTMTKAERVYLEIDMQSRARVLHSFDYDPFATR